MKVLGLNMFIYVLYDFTSFFKVFINIPEYANYISDYRKKVMCLSFNLTPSLALLG